ncbi:gephyrin-like molybdotransferase receptor GlpR [Streptomyces sp. SCSIO 75703]|uniref:divisome protein SepX/GlpR n=1 Tax=unclassified Streptomyces TaxID=2593676 RepID=UPI0006B49381|nr:gephyrin-like molybdotransferase receptor GlpR [Streptomyces sp. TP-A0875]
MSSSGLIYAVIVGAWAAYLVPMWLRRQDELNEARPTERFSTAIRLLSGRAGMERRYAKDRARSADEAEPPAPASDAPDPDHGAGAVDVREFAVSRPPRRPGAPVPAAQRPEPADADPAPVRTTRPEPGPPRRRAQPAAPSPAEAARARRSKVLARRRRTTVVLFLAFTAGSVVAAVGGLAFLWAPGAPAVLLSAYIVHLRTQERRRFAFQMDRRQAEVAAQRLRERGSRRRAPLDPADVTDADEPDEEPEAEADPGLSALAADRRALVEQTDHAEWVDQQRERQRRPGQGGESWDPVPVPLPTYVTAPVAPRATPDVDLGGPDAWSSARSSAVPPEQRDAGAGSAPEAGRPAPSAEDRPEDPGRSGARRAASARRSRERGRTPLFDQYEEGDRPRAANE